MKFKNIQQLKDYMNETFNIKIFSSYKEIREYAKNEFGDKSKSNADFDRPINIFNINNIEILCLGSLKNFNILNFVYKTDDAIIRYQNIYETTGQEILFTRLSKEDRYIGAIQIFNKDDDRPYRKDLPGTFVLDIDSNIIEETYFLGSTICKLDGPANINVNGNNEYYIFNKILDEDQYFCFLEAAIDDDFNVEYFEDLDDLLTICAFAKYYGNQKTVDKILDKFLLIQLENEDIDEYDFTRFMKRLNSIEFNEGKEKIYYIKNILRR